jgi:hypothetical protein
LPGRAAFDIRLEKKRPFDVPSRNIGQPLMPQLVHFNLLKLVVSRFSLISRAHIVHTPPSGRLKTLTLVQPIMGKFELGPASVRKFGLTASLNDRFAPEGAIRESAKFCSIGVVAYSQNTRRLSALA